MWKASVHFYFHFFIMHTVPIAYIYTFGTILSLFEKLEPKLDSMCSHSAGVNWQSYRIWNLFGLPCTANWKQEHLSQEEKLFFSILSLFFRACKRKLIILYICCWHIAHLFFHISSRGREMSGAKIIPKHPKIFSYL